tara:strand:+ start:19 stop:702 length:684 start_codon:yes stop_codon:yes gene_type:complete
MAGSGNLAAFTSAMRGGGARANQFEINVGRPGMDDEFFTMMCRSGQIPGLTMGEVTIPYRGRAIYAPGDRTYDAWTVTCYNDANYDIRGILEQWSNELQDIGSTTGARSNSIYRQAFVNQLDRNNRVIRGYALYGAWPTTIDAIDLAFDTNDTIEEFGVTFRFNYMTAHRGTVGITSRGTRSATNLGSGAGGGGSDSEILFGSKGPLNEKTVAKSSGGHFLGGAGVQ